MVVKIIPNGGTAPSGKLADAEVYFTEGEFLGLRLLGFAVWERRSGPGRNVTFPSRTYSVNGERRSFSLLRPTGAGGDGAQERVRDLILGAYAEYEAAAAVDAAPVAGAVAVPAAPRAAGASTSGAGW